MSVSISSKTIEIRVFKTSFGDFEIHDVMDILEELEATSYGFSHLVIYNPKLGDWLESLGACSKSIRGSYYRGENFKKVEERLQKVINETA
jgi:hypothetical protein